MLHVGIRRLWVSRGSSRSLLRNFSSNLAAESVPTSPPPPLPWLMLPSERVDDDSEKDDNFHFFSLAENKVVQVKKNFGTIPWRKHHFNPQGNIHLSGSSSYGWLSLVNKKNCELSLFNPFGNPLEFSQTYIALPPIESIRGCISSLHRQKVISTTATTVFADHDCEYQINAYKSHYKPTDISKKVIVKLAMSLPPLTNSLTSNEDCMVMARIQFGNSCRLVCCRPGDTSWTSLECAGEYGWQYEPHDFTYFSKDQLFYSLGSRGTLLSWDLRSGNSSVVYDCFPPKIQPSMNQHQTDVRVQYDNRDYYLVDFSGDLLLVVRYSTVAFDVYKFDFVNKKWVYVPDLGDDRVLFLGLNSFSTSLSENPGLKGSISGNSIYFSFHPSWTSNIHNCGVYNLNDGSITTFLPEQFSSKEKGNKKQSSPFIWIHPQH